MRRTSGRWLQRGPGVMKKSPLSLLTGLGKVRVEKCSHEMVLLIFRASPSKQFTAQSSHPTVFVSAKVPRHSTSPNVSPRSGFRDKPKNTSFHIHKTSSTRCESCGRTCTAISSKSFLMREMRSSALRCGHVADRTCVGSARSSSKYASDGKWKPSSTMTAKAPSPSLSA